MNADTLAAVYAHMLAEYPREACGVVIVERGVEAYLPCRNVAPKPADQFAMAPEDYAAADDRGEITVIVHSHPDVAARASEADLVRCEESGIPWVIVSVMPGPVVAETVTINPSGYMAPLVSRQWAHGVLDCWALCRDWYAREWGLDLPDPPRVDEWWNDGVTSLYNDAALGQAGFERVRDNALRKGDLIIMQIRSKNRVPNHAGVYIGDGQMLHHMYGRLSTRDTYGGYYAETTRAIWRHRFASTEASA